MTARKTALKGFVGGIWAVEPAWMRSALQVLQGNKLEIPQREDDLALMNRQGERPANTRYTTLQDKTAIIDLYGAVMPRANFLSEWSGGVSCELLAKDLSWALGNDAIENILFVIHSPGGEVTGVSEISEMIYQARSQKNITAYVSGMGCSAAYWIASACSKVYANPTSLLGSIGVMSVYLDDTKQLEMIGLEEIEFVSSQSPYKNPDPTTSDGKKRIQARVNSLAQVFVEAVARNRGVSTATVLKSFGQGDVFVGADAVKAGLADQIGNFGEALALIAQADPEVPMPDDEDEPDDNQDSTVAVESMNKGERKMADKEKPQAAETDTVQVDKAEFESMKSQLTELAEAKTKAAADLETLKAERLNDQITDIAKTLHGEMANHMLIMTELAKGESGMESEAFKAYVENQKALTAQIDKSELFKVVGSNRGGEAMTALEELDSKAEAIKTAKGCDFTTAFNEAVEANPELYARYNQERKSAQAA